MESTIISKKDYVKKRKVALKSRKYIKDKKYIIKAIEDTKNELKIVRMSFDYASDPKLIESIIYRERDIIARYEYLIRQAKKKGIKVDEIYIYNNACK